MSIMNLFNRDKTSGDNSPIQKHYGEGDNNAYYYNMALPISVSPYKIKNVIDLIYDKVDIIFENEDNYTISAEKRIKHTRKNELTGMSSTYFKSRIKPYLYLENELDEFLKNNKNRNEKKKYISIVRDINSKFVAYSSKFTTFDQLFDDMLTRFETAFLESYKEDEKSDIIEVLFAYMYFICDIPEVDDEDDKTR